MLGKKRRDNVRKTIRQIGNYIIYQGLTAKEVLEVGLIRKIE
jgi:hypothetical protein